MKKNNIFPINSLINLFKLLFNALLIGLLLAFTKQKVITRIIFWPVFVFSILMINILFVFIFNLITLFQFDDNSFILHFGNVYYSKFGNEYEYSIDVLFFILTIFSGFLAWKIINLLEFEIYNGTKRITLIEKIVGILFGTLFLSYLFNLTSADGHIKFFMNTFEYWSHNPF